MSEKDIEELLNKLNISKAQLPKIFLSDVAVPEGCEIGDVFKIERKKEGGVNIYYRVIV